MKSAQHDSGMSIIPSPHLFLVPYDNHPEDLKKLIHTINDEGRTSILWNHARGFMVHHHSRSYPLSENIGESTLSDPKEAIKFIIDKAQIQVDYIFEDFHHFIGKRDTVHPEIGEIRSLIKEMSRSINGREENIYFFVPSSYDLPPELTPFFNQLSKAERKAKGFLEKFGLLLTEENFIMQSKPVIGADAQIERVVQILSQMETNNPLLVGHPGVGKSAVVEGFAKALFKGDVPANLKGRMLYLISLNCLVAGTKYRGEFEERLEGLMEDVLKNKNRIIVFIDEIHTLLNAGSAEGAIGAGDALKPVLARGEFPCIGATTFDGAKYLFKDHALSRRFKKVVINEPSPDETLRILKGIAGCFEKHHSIKIEDVALMSAAYLSIKYLPDEYLPGKAIALIDGAAAYCRMKGAGRVREEDIMLEIEKTLVTVHGFTGSEV
ncbi:MAG: ATP-dependent Clp protease ATP-binding subunit [Deltaproteobacteria bacterium]|nr:ATP-dependent Clp protease ATP-binding subunit [Deltaproteobacteria bacterium]MBW2086173.1 ATP-dependent Clp protease ATP-binding subunit [Deltaproteobacteria bacterium]